MVPEPVTGAVSSSRACWAFMRRSPAPGPAGAWSGRWVCVSGASAGSGPGSRSAPRRNESAWAWTGAPASLPAPPQTPRSSSGPEPRGADSGRGPRPVRRRTGRRRGEESSIEPATGGGGPIRARDAHDSGGCANTSKRVQNAHRIHARRSRRRSRCGAAPPGPRRPPCGRRSAPRRWSSIGLRRWDTPAAAGPDGRCGLRGAGPGRAGKAKDSPAERVGVGLDGRPGELPGSAAHAALEHAPPAGPGAPVALPGRGHSRVQLAGISAPRRYRSR